MPLDERSGGLAREAARACKDAALRLDSVGRRLAVLAPARRLDGWREQLEVRRVRLPQAMAEILTRQGYSVADKFAALRKFGLPPYFGAWVCFGTG